MRTSVRRRIGAVLAVAVLAGACTEADDEPAQPEANADPASISPAPTGASTPPSSPTPDEPPQITLTVVGDLMLVRGVPDPAAALAPLSRRLRSADITVGNLESTLSTDGEPTQGSDSFGASPALLGPLRRAGFDALSLANNHAGDFGDRALVDTVETLRRSPIRPFGAGAGLAEASRPAVIEVEGVRFAFVGFNAIGETPRAVPGRPGALSVRMPPRTGPLVEADLDHVASVVRRAKRRADVVVVLPHWGTQYTHTPEPIQSAVARRLVEAGADLVVGGHPHWVQSAERIRGVPVLHSLGNFVFDMDFMTETMEGVFLETTWRGDELVRTRLVPYRMDPVSFAPREVRGEEAARILREVRIPAPAG
jgi:poly-gamma-glutamate capsule biosynthesis protein CapA/YwtB (metallophosphatase superfamily)